MKRIFIILLVLSPVIAGNAQNVQSPSSRAYPTGIYIFCGKEIPRNFHYLIEKKSAAGAWENVAEVRAPQNAVGFKANLLNLPPYFMAMMPFEYELADSLWKRQIAAPDVYSLYAYAYDPKIVASMGCGWFDDGLKNEGNLQYRISRVMKEESIVLGELNQRFPENQYKGTLKTIRFDPSPDLGQITLYYGVTDSVSTYKARLYRSRLMENEYIEVSADAAYATMNDRIVAIIRDETATKGFAYNYFAIPYDALGNLGMPSDTIAAYNLTNRSDIGLLTEFTAVGEKEKKGVALKWEMTSDYFILGYELFRSKNYDGDYQLIATLPANVNSYFDNFNIDPGEAYFYYMTVNNGFGANVPSARIPVILEGDVINFMPPQNLEATVSGNVVELKFQNLKADTRGYQIFRGEGYLGELSLIATMSVAAPSPPPSEGAGGGSSEEAEGGNIVIFNDTLSISYRPKTYSYAVADVNSSYDISPLSDRVSIQWSGGMITSPSGLDVQLRGDEIFVMWDDMTQINAFVSGYNLYRSTVSLPPSPSEEPPPAPSKGGVESKPEIIATLNYDANGYFDKDIIPGKHYRYYVETIDMNGELSGVGLHAGIFVPLRPPLPPGQVTAIAADNSILLRWDNPFDENIKSIRIYRAALNAAASLLKELPADQTAFEDQTAKPSEQYFYYVVTVNGRGEESRADEPVSGRIRGVAAQPEPELAPPAPANTGRRR